MGEEAVATQRAVPAGVPAFALWSCLVIALDGARITT